MHVLLSNVCLRWCKFNNSRYSSAKSFCGRRREGNSLFTETLNTFCLWLCGVRHMVKDHLDSERGNPLPPQRLLFPINSKLFYMHHPTDRIAHTTTYVTPVVEHWLEREIAQWVADVQHHITINKMCSVRY